MSNEKYQPLCVPVSPECRRRDVFLHALHGTRQRHLIDSVNETYWLPRCLVHNGGRIAFPITIYRVFSLLPRSHLTRHICQIRRLLAHTIYTQLPESTLEDANVAILDMYTLGTGRVCTYSFGVYAMVH